MKSKDHSKGKTKSLNNFFEDKNIFSQENQLNACLN